MDGCAIRRPSSAAPPKLERLLGYVSHLASTAARPGAGATTIPNPPASPRPRSLVAALAPAVGSTVRVCGWAEPTEGDLVLRDHTGRVRLVGQRPDVVAESAIEVVGEVITAADGQVEILLEELSVAGPALATAPISASSPLEAEPGRESGEAGLDHARAEVPRRGERHLVAGPGQRLGQGQHRVEMPVTGKAGGQHPHGRHRDPLAIIARSPQARTAPRLR